MSKSTPTARIRLVTIIAPYESLDGLGEELKALGARGFTWMKANGRGTHGRRQSSLLDPANICIEVLAPAPLAGKILELVAAKHSEDAMVAFATEVEAVPAARFA